MLKVPEPFDVQVAVLAVPPIEPFKAIAELGCKKILIQDGARPFTSNEIIRNCIMGLDKFDVVFPAIKIPDTLYVEVKENNQSTIDTLGLNRESLIRAQTPQAFHFDYIYQRYLNSDTAVPHRTSISVC